MSNSEARIVPLTQAPLESDLRATAGGEDLAALLARRERWKPNRWTWALLGVLVLGLGFMSGAMVAKTMGLSSSSKMGFAPPGGGAMPDFGSGGLPPGSGGTGIPSSTTGLGISGTVKVASKGRIYVTDGSRQTIIVTVPSSATITISEPGDFSNIKPGDTVTIEGAPSDDGVTMTATSVSAMPASALKSGEANPAKPSASTSAQPSKGASQ